MTDRPKTSAAAPQPAAAPQAAAEPVDEFAHVPSPRTRHPLLALGAAALAFFLVFHIRHDARYALSATDALDIGDASAVFAKSGSAGMVARVGLENRYVRVRGTPDRESALELDTKGSWVFTTFFRILGTHDRLFVHRRENPLPAVRAEQDVFEGRLIRMSDLSFRDSIGAYFSKHVSATHFFAPEDLARALRATPGAAIRLRDRAGDDVSMPQDDTVALDVIRPDEVRVGLPRGRFPSEADARAAVAKQGGEVLSSAAVVESTASPAAPSTGPLSLASSLAPVERWVLVARFPRERRDAALSALGDLDPKVEIRDARETVKARLADLSATADALVVKLAGASDRTLPLASVAAARTLATVEIPSDAYLLIEADHPRDHVMSVFIALALVMFGAVNLVALARELRRPRLS
jgi:hypothetical protein